jgi:hypothetical protein
MEEGGLEKKFWAFIDLRNSYETERINSEYIAKQEAKRIEREEAEQKRKQQEKNRKREERLRKKYSLKPHEKPSFFQYLQRIFGGYGLDEKIEGMAPAIQWTGARIPHLLTPEQVEQQTIGEGYEPPKDPLDAFSYVEKGDTQFMVELETEPQEMEINFKPEEIFRSQDEIWKSDSPNDSTDLDGKFRIVYFDEDGNPYYRDYDPNLEDFRGFTE